GVSSESGASPPGRRPHSDGLAMIVIAFFFALAADAGVNDAIVARIGDKPVYYSAIRCDARQLRVVGRPGSAAYTAEEQCRPIEQARLNELVVPPLYEVASRELNVAVTIEEVRSRMALGGIDDAAIRRLSQQSTVLPSAILEVLSGRDLHQVWQERLSAGGRILMSEEAFVEIIRATPSVAAARRLLADASFEETKEQLIAVERNELLAEKIYQSISA